MNLPGKPNTTELVHCSERARLNGHDTQPAAVRSLLTSKSEKKEVERPDNKIRNRERINYSYGNAI